MNLKKWLPLLLMVGIIMIGACGCMKTTANDFKDKGKIVLTERQIEILEAKGLPTDFEQLTDRQQMTIIDIEEMLQAVEKKYGKKFCYVGYTAEEQLESGVLTAKLQGSNTAIRDSFTVMRSSDGGFVDTYTLVLVRDVYERITNEMMASIFAKSTYKHYATVQETNIEFTELPVVSMSNRVVADNWIFFDGSEYQNVNRSDISDGVIKLFTEAEFYGSLYIVVAKGDCFDSITKDTFADFLSDEYVIYRNFVNIIKER